MKKMLVILLNVFVAATMFTGCGKQDTSVLEKNDQESVSVSSEFEKSVNSSGESDIVEDDFEGFNLDGYSYEAESNGFYIVSTYGTSLYGLVNSKGDIVIPAEYDEMKFGSNDRVLLKVEGKWGVYDTDGKEVLPFVYDDIAAGVHNYYVKQDGNDMVVDSAGNIVKQLDSGVIYDRMIGDLYLHGRIASNGNAVSNAFCDLNGNYDIKWAEYLEDAGLYRVYKSCEPGGDWETIDIVDENGNCLYEITNKAENEASYTAHILNSSKICSLERIEFGFAAQNSNSTSSNECYIYNLETQERSDTTYEDIGWVGCDEIYGRTSDRIDIFDLDGNLVNSFALTGYDKCVCVGEIFVVQYGETYRIYNETGEEITGGDRYLDYSASSVDGKYIRIQDLSGQWGVLDKNGKEIIPFGYTDEYSYNGLDIKNESIVNGKLQILTGDDYGTLHLFVLE